MVTGEPVTVCVVVAGKVVTTYEVAVLPGVKVTTAVLPVTVTATLVAGLQAGGGVVVNVAVAESEVMPAEQLLTTLTV